MPADYSELNSELDSLESDLSGFDTVKASLEALLDKQAQMITDAVTADNAIDQTATTAAVAHVKTINSAVKQRLQELTDAMLAGTPAEGGGGSTPSPKKR